MSAHPYAVRQQASSRALSEKFIVVKNPSGGRVSTWPHVTRAAAQAEADDLNIAAMVKDHADDPRPYAERLAEAEKAYRAEDGR